ncbi:MAG: hypothetical protein ACFB51_21370 [Anaerolineae bacterium]
MLEGIPISGYILCYGPLALTVIGFIIFAALTDVDARRTYLRWLDPRPEEERLQDHETPVITREIKAETPSGVRVIIKPPTESVESE